MGAPFPNPVVGDGGALVLPSIHSPGYVADTTGWSINQDGSADLNDATIRGVITNEGGLLVYDGQPAAGSLIASLGIKTIGSDSYGNAYLEGNTGYSNPVPWEALQVFQNRVVMYSASSYEGPWVQAADIVLGTTGVDITIGSEQLSFSAAGELAVPGEALISGLLKALAGLSVAGGATADTLDVTTSATIAAAAAIPAIEPGTTSTPETWHSLTLASGVSAVSGWQAPSYQVDALGNIEISAALSFTAGGTGNDHVASIPSGWHGSDGLIFIPCAIITFPGSSGVHAGYATLASNGNLNVHGITASGTAEVVLGTGGTLSLG